jgi:hypothetical protein
VSDVDETVVEEVEAILEPEPAPEPQPVRVRAPELPSTFSAVDDPRAMAGIRRMKGFGGLAGFVLTGLAAHLHGELMASVLLRALAGGLAGYMVVWLGAVTVWRRIIRAELHHTVEMVKSARAAARQADAS